MIRSKKNIHILQHYSVKVVPNVNQIGKLGTVGLERLLAASALKHSLGKGEGELKRASPGLLEKEYNRLDVYN